MNDLEKAILTTVAYFDMFDYPLTAVEIWKWIFIDKKLSKLASLSDIHQMLNNGDYLKKKIAIKNGFYFLKSRKHIIATRQVRYNIAEKKFKKAIRIVRCLRSVPFIKMIAVCNNLAYSNAKKDSDIDFFIIVKDDRLWLTRFLITAIVHLSGMRRYGNHITDRICLSFYITDKHLNLESLMIKPLDPYFVFWLSQLVPVYDYQDAFTHFIAANRWIKQYLPNIFFYKTISRRLAKDIGWTLFWKKFFETILRGPLGNGLDRLFRSIQKRLITGKKYSKLWEQDTAVVVGDDILKFHEQDQREAYRLHLERSLSKLV